MEGWITCRGGCLWSGGARIKRMAQTLTYKYVHTYVASLTLGSFTFVCIRTYIFVYVSTCNIMFMMGSLSPLHRYCIATYRLCNTVGHVWDQGCISHCTLYYYTRWARVSQDGTIPPLSLCMQRRMKELVENARSEGLDSVPVSHRDGLACVH